MKQIATVCARDCYDTCSLLVIQNDSGKLISIKGDPKNPYTQGFACPRGVKDLERLSTNRIEQPFARHAGRLEPVSWETALNRVAQKLNDTIAQKGPESVLNLLYAGNTGLLSSIFPKRLWYALGATQTDGALCSTSGHQALALHYGESYGIDPLELFSQDLIVFWGFNAAVSSPHLWSLARKTSKANAIPLIVIDPRQSQAARQADIWIQPRPGSDVALAYGIMSYLLEHQAIEREFLHNWTIGFDQLQTEIMQWTPERVERVTAVPWSQIELLGKAYAHRIPSVTLIGIGLQKCEQGADQVRTVALIPTLLGLHRGFFYSNSAAFNINDDELSGRTLTQIPGKIVEQVALADSVRRGDFRFLYINGMNPALTLPNQQAFRAGLERDDLFVVVHDSHWTATTEYADVVLPAPTYLEKEDLVLPWSHRFVRYSPQIVPPVTNSRSETQIMQALAMRLGLTQDWLFADPWEAVERALENAFESGTVADLKAGEMLKLTRKLLSHYSTRSGKIELLSAQAAAKGISPLPQQRSLQRDPEQFIFLTSASPSYSSTQFQEIYGPIPAIVEINPSDAERLNIQNGQEVTLTNERGQISMNAVLSERVPSGVVWSPRQSADLNGIPQNSLMSSAPQEIGSGPRFNSTLVLVLKEP